MSKVVAGPGALLEGQGTVVGSTGRYSAYVIQNLTEVDLAGQSCSAAVHLPTVDAQA